MSPDHDTHLEWPRLLGRVNGKDSTARRLLQMFIGDHGGSVAAAGAAFAAGNADEARRISHRLAGTAANLSLPRLAAAAKACEALSAAGDAAAEWPAALARLDAAFADTIAAIAAFLPTLPPSATAPAADGEDHDALTPRLRRLLAANDLAALSVLERWKVKAPPELAAAVDAAVGALDFAGALALLDRAAGERPHD